MAINILPTRRNLRFKLDPSKALTWHQDGRNVSQFLNTLSLFFPVGERFFIDSVRHYRDVVQDPELKKAVTAFIGQEAMHGREHEEYNGFVNDAGVPIEAQERLVDALLKRLQKSTPASFQLAGTVALEHLTAILADGLLSLPEIMEGSDEGYRALWNWHALEETEHKAVAFDLYQDVDGGYWRRQRTFFTGTAYLIGFSAYFTWQFLKQDGVNRKPLTLAKGLWKMFGYRGVVSGAIPAWFQYLRPDFHPWQDDNTHLLDEWRATLPEPAAYPPLTLPTLLLV